MGEGKLESVRKLTNENRERNRVNHYSFSHAELHAAASKPSSLPPPPLKESFRAMVMEILLVYVDHKYQPMAP